jgi:hypothetical protein
MVIIKDKIILLERYRNFIRKFLESYSIVLKTLTRVDSCVKKNRMDGLAYSPNKEGVWTGDL